MSRDAEELSAQRIVLEAQMVIEESQREELLSQELREIHFAQAVRLQTQQELQHWERQERAAYETRIGAWGQRGELSNCFSWETS